MKTKREIDVNRVAELTEHQIDEPGFVTPLPLSSGGGVCPIDGHHRAVKSFQLGRHYFEVYIVPVEDLPSIPKYFQELQLGEKQIDFDANSWKSPA